MSASYRKTVILFVYSDLKKYFNQLHANSRVKEHYYQDYQHSHEIITENHRQQYTLLKDSTYLKNW